MKLIITLGAIALFCFNSINVNGQNSLISFSLTYNYNHNYVVRPGPGGLVPFENVFTPNFSFGFSQNIKKLKLPLALLFNLNYSQLGGKYTAGPLKGNRLIWHGIGPSVGLGTNLSKIWSLRSSLNYDYLVNTNKFGIGLQRNLLSFEIATGLSIHKNIKLELIYQPFITPYVHLISSPTIYDKEYWRIFAIGATYSIIK